MFEGVNAGYASRILASEIREERESRQLGRKRTKKEQMADIDDLAV